MFMHTARQGRPMSIHAHLPASEESLRAERTGISRSMREDAIRVPATQKLTDPQKGG